MPAQSLNTNAVTCPSEFRLQKGCTKHLLRCSLSGRLRGCLSEARIIFSKGHAVLPPEMDPDLPTQTIAEEQCCRLQLLTPCACADCRDVQESGTCKSVGLGRRTGGGVNFSMISSFIPSRPNTSREEHLL